MANYTVTDTELTTIADAIIAKARLSGQLEFPDDFVDGIEGISTGTDVSDTTAVASDVRTGKYFYNSAGVKTQGGLANGSATTPATTITTNPSITVSSSGLITATNSKTQSVTPSVSAGYVFSGTAGTITVSGSNTSQLTTQAAQTITPGTTNQTITSGKYLTGTQTILGDADLVAGNIKKDVQIFGVTGTYEGSGSTLPDATGEYFGTPNTIQFQINSVLYSADVGMTWGQWIESEYNTIGAYINTSTGKITKPNGYILADNYTVNYPGENTIIIESPEYCRYTFNPDGGPI